METNKTNGLDFSGFFNAFTKIFEDSTRWEARLIAEELYRLQQEGKNADAEDENNEENVCCFSVPKSALESAVRWIARLILNEMNQIQSQSGQESDSQPDSQPDDDAPVSLDFSDEEPQEKSVQEGDSEEGYALS